MKYVYINLTWKNAASECLIDMAEETGMMPGGLE